ncbi:hypothetical protein [Pantoea ananatis]|uniref:hypothetical protein n=1 Tax=Pantoea ananas TaxID=553 RepID=UPI000F85F61C|nr:hypothetical protein [Pantoea ananatis]RQN03371.1 hypothetical protein EHQ51_00225 [Pantoea ananatis]
MSETIKEIAGVLKDALITPVQEAFVYRARNPFFGTLVITWLVYNWNKIAFFFYSDVNIIQRIEYIKHKIPDNSVIFGIDIPHTHSFWFPFLFACFISLTFPLFTLASIWVHKKITGKIEKLNSGKEKDRIILQKDLVIEIAKNESAKAKQLAIDDAEIASYREIEAKKISNIEILKTTKSTLESEIESLEAQKKSTNSTLEISTTELGLINKKLEETNSNFESALSRFGDYESLAQKHKLRGMELNTLDKKIKELQAEFVTAKKENNEIEIKYKNENESLRSMASNLSAELKESNDKLDKANLRLSEYMTKEHYSSRIKRDEIIGFDLKIDSIVRDLINVISGQKQLDDSMKGIFQSISDTGGVKQSTVSEARNASNKRELFEQNLESIKEEIIKLKEIPRQSFKNSLTSGG